MLVTVDLVVLTIGADDLQVLLIKRAIPPYRGRWALPGGFVRPHEDLTQAAWRELADETGVGQYVHKGHLEQLATYGKPRRDPRGRVVTVAYLALLPDLPAPVAGSDAKAAAWYPTTGLPGLAFDHDRILADGIERARSKLEYTPLATAFCPAEFTVAQLRDVYQAAWGVPLDPRNFHRKVTTTAGFVEPLGRTTEGDRGRPAQLYRRGPADVLYPPMLRPTTPPP